MHRLFCIVISVIFGLFFSLPIYGATISGTVYWKGKPPKMRAIKMGKDAICVNRWKGKPKPRKETLVINDQKLANTFVMIKSGLTKKTYPVPSVPFLIDQNGCRYVPHVFAVQKGQAIKFINSDGTRHNIHALPKINRQFNLSMSKTLKESKEKKFSKLESFFKIKCDIHPWMRTWATVLAHPFYSISNSEGTFTIEGLPAGTYEVETWHESLKSQTVKVTIAENETKKVDFTFVKNMKEIKK